MNAVSYTHLDVYKRQDVYILYDCASSFEQQTGPVETTWEYLDSERHIKTVTQAKYCGFCFGTTKTTDTITEPHNLEESIRPELAHDRFVIMDSCKDCEYGKTQYVLAKSVVANYEGVVDGQPHTITVSDLSEAGVTTQIRYGESAETCTLTSAPNYTEAGSYPVYYQITYTYDDVNMVEDGVAYVRLVDALSLIHIWYLILGRKTDGCDTHAAHLQLSVHQLVVELQNSFGNAG